jgi:hypothetical protein
MMQNPAFLQSMSEMMSRPEVVDQVSIAEPSVQPPTRFLFDFVEQSLTQDTRVDHRFQPATIRDGTADQADDGEPYGSADDVKSRDTKNGKSTSTGA